MIQFFMQEGKLPGTTKHYSGISFNVHRGP